MKRERHAFGAAFASEPVHAKPFAPPKPSEVGVTNYCDKAGAHLLKDKIEQYWRSRGQDVVVWLDETGFHPALRAIRVDVRSDMINGLPRPLLEEMAKAQAPGGADSAGAAVD